MSSMSKTPSSNNITSTESPEESGWTKYFADFFNSDHNNRNNNIHDQKYSISFSGLDHSSSSSLVSDAVSLAAAKKFTNIAQAGSFKKRKKIKTTLVDDDLMDTASSPINSPKVLYENQFSKANEKEKMELHQEKGKGNCTGERDGEKGLGFNERDSDRTELKKKGLCLVPLSIVTNYLG